MMRTSGGKWICLVAVAAVAVVSAEQQDATMARFKEMTTLEQVVSLKAAARLDSTLGSKELLRVLELATASADADVRRHAFGLASYRAGAARLAKSSEVRDNWRRDRADLQKLEQPAARALLTDLDERVRRSALDALANLQYDGGEKTNIGIAVGRVFVETLAVALDQEPSPSVRAEIVKSLALSDSDLPAHVTTLESALADSEPAVLQFALLGLARHGVQRSVSKAIDFLSHGDMRVRSAAIQAIATLGLTRAGDLERVQAAYAAETDASVKEMIRQTISKLVK